VNIRLPVHLAMPVPVPVPLLTPRHCPHSPPSPHCCRYAWMYGLKRDSWRDANHCGIQPDETESSRKWHGNWFCF